MPKAGKIYKANAAKVDRTKKYSVDDALSIIDSFQPRKFDESIELVVKLGVDPKQSDQMVRGATVLPNGIGKTIRVACFVRGEAEKEAREAGADFVGNDDLLEKIEKGWLEFDRLLTTPESLKDLTKVAKVLGPKGMMPNKKTGTVSSEIGKAVKEQKLGKVEYKVEKAGIVHTLIGKKSFGSKKLKENLAVLYENILKAKPSTSKGVYIRKVALAPTMGPSIIVDAGSMEALARGL
ncbi:MAG: 50S ribosomal protein L1 [Proteobacteria bacterium]|nr:50S ribosomal protein L1 [Pseudomonadota bacterium]NDC24480.1 50S ribosomal protein L1 [Pseudomonadota bacterium]NDG26864.1 50S ribosomal protein L1 [Pseudomonadota bacterium]